MTLPLSDMNRDALVRELRIAQSRGNMWRVAKVKAELAKRNDRDGWPRKRTDEPRRPNWWDRD